ncbi:unnamed protein product [Didymodactylos carnosus]|uniref:Transglutaminase-like domain-containing protein n=1 Tax=Didymodactylos carnosus TaxID=1234261 RepID=A0A814DLM7_9BILA|nr:unnamed protein product [Didymodactylos carnosus]CAF1346938.1 unnamed protein product [Didymodactylos carnosus]CAF3732190.1 unnamed protein product [Didymodactylos carnosus]CAF4157878.1 unnamed protein product [Didymodactylos carnosus]
MDFDIAYSLKIGSSLYHVLGRHKKKPNDFNEYFMCKQRPTRRSKSLSRRRHPAPPNQKEYHQQRRSVDRLTSKQRPKTAKARTNRQLDASFGSEQQQQQKPIRAAYRSKTARYRKKSLVENKSAEKNDDNTPDVVSKEELHSMIKNTVSEAMTSEKMLLMNSIKKEMNDHLTTLGNESNTFISNMRQSLNMEKQEIVKTFTEQKNFLTTAVKQVSPITIPSPMTTTLIDEQQIIDTIQKIITDTLKEQKKILTDSLKETMNDEIKKTLEKEKNSFVQSIQNEKNSLINTVVQTIKQNNLSPTASTTNQNPRQQQHTRQQPPLNEIKLITDQTQTRIDAQWWKQRHEVVTNAKLREYVNQWSQIKSMDALTDQIKLYSQTELERSWLLFCWICTNIKYDSSCGINNAATVFETRRGVCRGMVSLYHECCTLMSIDCIEISGYVKNKFLKYGEKLEDSKHAWNSVVIDKHHYLVDPTWGSSENDKSGKVKLEDFYFLTSPEQLIYTHYSNGFQLLSPEITKSEFLSLPVMKSTYYRLNLNLISPKQGFNEINQNPFKIIIKASKDVQIMVQLSTGDIEYPRDLHTLCQRDNEQEDLYNCYLVAPIDGLYDITIYAKNDTETSYKDAIQMRLNVKDVSQAPTFPTLYQPFTKYNCSIIEPLRRLVYKNEKLLIHMKIPDANVLKIHNGEDYIIPNKDEYKNNILKKTIIVDGNVDICARWDDNADSINVICRFTMLEQ